MNKHSWQIALAYMSVVIGGGFASGNEVLQFFTGYGIGTCQPHLNHFCKI